MRIFVSYAREDIPFCIRIIETLRAHEVWYDQRLRTGQDWWQEILRRLEWCELFIHLQSPESAASRYCRRELEIARRLKRDIIPVLIDKAAALPEKIRESNYVDLSDNLTADTVSRLLNAILIVERQRAGLAGAPGDSLAGGDRAAPVSSPAELISNAVRALETGDFDTAIRLLKRAKASGYQSRFVRLDKLLQVAEAATAERKQSREIDREYQHIVALFAFESTRKMACEALGEFQREFGDYDPQNLRRHCVSGAGDSAGPAKATRNPANVSAPPRIALGPTVKAASQRVATEGASDDASLVKSRRPSARAGREHSGRTAAPAPAAISPNSDKMALAGAAEDNPLGINEALPMLQWCDIPHGTVTIASVVGADEEFGEMTEQVDNFVMSKYPVTNAQFAIFVKAQDGYRNPRWWGFSEHARRWFNAGKGAAESRFNGDAQPRENVNFYEAMAFANWLGAQLKMKITLPTIWQWQRAAKGDDDRYYPWGDEYDEDCCNTVETGLKMTTPVNRYRKGISPYGVFDMAGNIWEWTLNRAAAAETGRDYRRAVVGGSYVSSCDRAQTAYRHYFDPWFRFSSIGIRLVGLT